jgi:hypothetical protein
VAKVVRQVLRPHLLAVHQADRPLDDLLQLAHVERPVVPLEEVEGFLDEVVTNGASIDTREHVLDEQRDVLGPPARAG